MNTQVTATGMKVQAVAESGLVISNASDGTYDASADTVKTEVAHLHPGSTKDLSTWLHSVSTDPSVANKQQTYTAGVAWAAAIAAPATPEVIGNYVVHDFYIRSSAAEALTITSLDVVEVTAKLASSDPAAQNLSKSLRVGVKVDGSSNIYIYAPVTGYTATVSVQNAVGDYSSSRTDVSALASNTVSHDTEVTSIPANTAHGTHVQVFVWYEGEDAACISNNIIAGLETLTITVKFGYTA